MGMGLVGLMRIMIILSSMFLSLSNDSYPVDDNEASTMLALRSSLSPAPASSWTASDTFCNWSGVECDTSSSHVISIDLSHKSLVGILPSDLSSLSHLRILSLQNNTLIGAIPYPPDSVVEIHLDSNSFSSVTPDAFLYPPSLQILTLNHNPLLQWEFPFTQGCPNLTVFEAVDSGMSGSFPPYLYWFPSLQVLRLSHNQLTGNISQRDDQSFPSNFTSKLRTLWLDHQDTGTGTGLSGPLDPLASFPQLTQVWVNHNSFSGTIPDLSTCTNLSDLQLNDNLLHGFVPASLSSLPNLRNVSLQNNALFGPFPNFSTQVQLQIGNTSNFCSDKPGVPCDEQVIVLLDVVTEMGYPGNLLDAWKGNNACKWRFIGCDHNATSVTTINMAGQQFDGDIPYSLGDLTTLLELHLNDNAFSGHIPQSFTLLPHLKVLNVSNNYLTGTVPKFRSSVKVYVDDNSLVANQSVFQAASAGMEDPEKPSPGSDFGSPAHSSSILGMKVKTFIPVCVTLATLVVFAASALIYLLSKRYKKRRHGNEWEEDSAGQLWDKNASDKQDVELRGLLTRFSYENLKLITGNFDPKRKLGEGGFGSVYEGNLMDGTKVAVKRLDRIGQGRKEFLAEVMTLGRIHHVNLVKLIGFCDENAYRLLVYERMSNGSLDTWIFHKPEQQEPSLLSWNTRKNIILQIAKGLAYLHEECQQRIAHLDIKPQNILLDENFNAKVADFGLAKLIDREESFVMTQMRGTRGYLAPEWLSRKITEKADVYSFGVVLLEVVFGRRNLEYCKNHEEGDDEEERANRLLVHVVKKKAEANTLLDLVEGCYQDVDENGEEVEKMAKFAIFCLHENPSRRPTMSNVVKALEGQMNMVLMDLESSCSSNCTTSSYPMGSSGSSSVSASVLSGPR